MTESVNFNHDLIKTCNASPRTPASFARKKDSCYCCPFRRRYLFFLMGCSKKKLYNVLGGFYISKYTMLTAFCLHFFSKKIIKMFLTAKKRFCIFRQNVNFLFHRQHFLFKQLFKLFSAYFFFFQQQLGTCLKLFHMVCYNLLRFAIAIIYNTSYLFINR